MTRAAEVFDLSYAPRKADAVNFRDRTTGGHDYARVIQN